MSIHTRVTGFSGLNAVCDRHGGAVGHATLALAEYHAADPLGWCEVCMAARP